MSPKAVQTRICRKCGGSDFNASNACRPCGIARARAWREANPERLRTVNAAYREANREQVLAQKREHWEANKEALNEARRDQRASEPERARAQQRETYWRNRERIILQQRASYRRNVATYKSARQRWYERNKGAAIAQMAQYDREHPEVRRRARKAWKARNPERVRETGRVRGLRVRLSGRLSKGLIQRLHRLQQGKCPCCGKPLGNRYHLDHVVPLALGGEHADHNMQLLRDLCNLQKSRKHPVDFMQSRGFLL